jgi:hypothetical protein
VMSALALLASIVFVVMAAHVPSPDDVLRSLNTPASRRMMRGFGPISRGGQSPMLPVRSGWFVNPQTGSPVYVPIQESVPAWQIRTGDPSPARPLSPPDYRRRNVWPGQPDY